MTVEVVTALGPRSCLGAWLQALGFVCGIIQLSRFAIDFDISRADVYNDSEELLGKWFKRTGKRSDIFLTTKFGFTKEHSVRGDPEYVKERINSSLARFGVDSIDLVYQHR